MLLNLCLCLDLEDQRVGPKFGPMPMPMSQNVPQNSSKDFMDDMPKRVMAMKDGGELKKLLGPAMGAGMSRAKLKKLFEMAKKMKANVVV